jgi:hypothetical protein
VLPPVAGESALYAAMTDYTICFDARWILYPLGALCGFVFGVGVVAMAAEIRTLWRNHKST